MTRWPRGAYVAKCKWYCAGHNGWDLVELDGVTGTGWVTFWYLNSSVVMGGARMPKDLVPLTDNAKQMLACAKVRGR